MNQVIDAEKILQQAGLQAGMTFADFGVGRQAPFTMAAGKLLGHTGRIYILDIVKEVLQLITDRTAAQGMTNVTAVWTDLEIYGAAKQVPDGSVDVGVLSDTLFQSNQREAMVRECARMIKPNGTLILVDWKPQPTVIGPPAERRVRPDEMKEIMTRDGFKLVEEFEAGEYHWGLLFQK